MDAVTSPQSWHVLAHRPGFLIRRLHQIHLALFADACGEFGVTPVQYSILTVASAKPGLDQAAMANEVGVDRATMADVLARLERRGLVRRSRAARDARLKLVHVTVTGRRLLTRMDQHARNAHERTIAPLPPAERAAFIDALVRLVESGNDLGRAPLRLA
jgi:MarR family transcriptional regulator, lower aerobic nicotinate degradation pathway regulator